MLEHEDFAIAALLEEGRLTREQVEEARRLALERGKGIGEAISMLGLLPAREVAVVRAETCEVCFVDLDDYEPDFGNTGLMPRSLAESLRAFPLFVFDALVTVGMANPLDLRAVDQLRTALRRDVEPVLCEPAALSLLIDRAYSLAGKPAAARQVAASIETAPAAGAEKEPIIAAIDQILAQAVERGASDIHIGPDEHELHLRYRIDGILQPQQGPGLQAHSALIRRLKVMANLDLTQTRRPQDGKFRFTHADRPVDVRVSIIPTVSGENAVMRVLSGGAAIRTLGDLGMAASDSAEVERCLDQPHGMLLVTGPTGSGKTTTVYTGLKRLNTADRNILTIEDPVEIRMPLIRQVQVQSEIGMTFASALRSILRQDPDVVFVGEIRDEETARIAVQAALTGHLVLSTLHTNDAAGAVPRLRDFGCPAFAINAALLGVIAQRLVRRVCDQCAAACPPEDRHRALFDLGGDERGFVRGAGCGRCNNTGHRGRLGVYEVLRMAPRVQRAVEQGADLGRLRVVAGECGMRPMWRDALDKARLGLTTLDEVTRVVAVQLSEEEEPPETSASIPIGGEPVGGTAERKRSA